MQKIEAMDNKRYFSIDEIIAHLQGVEYIIMAAPAPEKFEATPIHFTIFLNTQEAIPEEIKGAVFEKFCQDYNITSPEHVMNQLMPVGFAQTPQETPMPLLLIDPQDQRTIPALPMHVIDFLADSDDFPQTKNDQLTGWSYSYN